MWGEIAEVSKPNQEGLDCKENNSTVGISGANK